MIVFFSVLISHAEYLIAILFIVVGQSVIYLILFISIRNPCFQCLSDMKSASSERQRDWERQRGGQEGNTAKHCK